MIRNLNIRIMKKTSIITTLNELSKEFQLEDLVERLIVIEKIDAGLIEAKEGKTVSHLAAKKSISKWLK